jgi:hypothetical protein
MRLIKEMSTMFIENRNYEFILRECSYDQNAKRPLKDAKEVTNLLYRTRWGEVARLGIQCFFGH